VVDGRAAQDVDAHAHAGTRVPDAMPSLPVLGQQVRDVALVPHVARRLHRFVRLAAGEAGLLVAAAQVADHAPTAVEVDTARGPFGKHHGEDVEAAVGVGVEQVPDGATLVRLLRPRRHRIVRGQQGRHRGPHRLRPLPIGAERRVVERGFDRGDEVGDGGSHGGESRGYRPAVLERVPLLSVVPTPLEPMDRLAGALGLPPDVLFVKRDDLTGVGGGGNKARKLEFLAADARAQGCDTLVTGGGRQSNHVRITAAVANRLDLGCTVVLSGGEPSVPTGNVVLDYLLGAEIVWTDAADYYATEEAIARECDRLAAEGRTPYRMPIGGASTVGALGYVACALELTDQLPDLTSVVTADGSGGTHAGLVAGLGDHAKVLGVDVGTRPDLLDRVPEKAAEAAALAGLPEPIGAVRLDVDRFGPGYGAPTDEALEALRLAARTEGLILDPVYTAKAMAGLVHAVRSGDITADDKVVFVHTGGTPALFARGYADWVRS